MKGERKISDLVGVYSKLPGEHEKSDVAFPDRDSATETGSTEQ